jgi:hypothetical protein
VKSTQSQAGRVIEVLSRAKVVHFRGPRNAPPRVAHRHFLAGYRAGGKPKVPSEVQKKQTTEKNKKRQLEAEEEAAITTKRTHRLLQACLERCFERLALMWCH